ncbi:bifunctional riboflavin kinase/FAD synthetase [Geothermobacter hydrogeniphilus]|uniref:Riboflavin biosynthesis protein n=1 Tax=Geothermobacter hydrogeniphilus TaxID=1969733 RepID=A0A1X0Y257_9BACT|nr:bifunctional riboflavin kinase/FAD synthetase [Geothermobacter hydrogeniphilus]ORJ59132.1 riboflavin biosynthesis protein RibF [Geothermobacter hydrogeniphilus]
MRIIRQLDECCPPLERGVVTIGNFDGVHLGHREIFRRVVRRARELNGLATVLTFVPHPLKVLTPERAPRLLNTYAEKERLIAASCIDVLAAIPFDREMAEMSPEAFVGEILVGRLGICHLIVGYDYAFGRNREGDVDFLRRAGKQAGFSVEMLEPIRRGEEVFSSTLVRRRLAAGDVAGAVALLGRHFNLEGRVIHGASRGRSLGFPTANLLTDKEVLPRPGVYAVKVRLDEQIFDGVMNIGFNPTFGTERISLEVHLLDFSADIYDRSLRVYFVERLREEMVFSSVDDLVCQIRRDVDRARQLLADREVIVYRDYLDCGLEKGA